MAMIGDDYRSQLQALLPPGAAWPRDPGADLTRLLAALAAEFGRVDGRADDLIDEADPRTVAELLEEWEAEYGLPDILFGAPATIQERIETLVAKVTALGGNSIAYFVALAARIGVPITIRTFRPFVAGSAAGEPVSNSTDWRFVWEVNAPEVTIRAFVAGSAAGEPLRTWGNDLLEGILNKLKPAHTKIIFTYGG